MDEWDGKTSITLSDCPLLQWDVWSEVTAAFADHAGNLLGGSLPAEVGGMVVAGNLTAVRAAPRRIWLFGRMRQDLPGGLPAELGAENDLREGRERIVVRSPRLRDILAQCLAVDWDRTLGRATFAPMHRIPVMFIRHSVDEGAFVVPRTFSQSIVDWLEEC